MTVSLSDEQAQNWRRRFAIWRTHLTPPVATTPEPTPRPTPVPSTTLPELDPRFVQVAYTDFPGTALPSGFYAYSRSDGNEGKASSVGTSQM
jgi:hypothetical protein